LRPTGRVWIETAQSPVPAEILAAAGGRPRLAQALVRRGFLRGEQARAFMDPACYTPADPRELPDLQAAVDCLEGAVRKREAVCVWGDFDVDGQAATTLLVEVLRTLGGDVGYHIPVRARESHGIHLGELERVLEGGARWVLSCDTGITAHEAAGRIRQSGAQLIITDHHDLPERLPEAAAVVNPKRLPGEHPLSGLPGVGVAYQVALELARRFDREESARECLDLVALGIVADLAAQTGDTRCLLQRGLAALRVTRRVGLLAMYELAGLEKERISEEHIGFVIGPRLNALGRLADANPAVEFLTTHDPVRARILAAELEGLNAQRRLLCEQVYQAAQAQIERDPSLLEGAALVLAHPAWPAGVIGIVASRLVEAYQRPAVLIACLPGETARGSARSIEGCNISAAIAEQSDLLEGFGGHPMAAGLGIAPDRIPEFRRGLNRSVAAQLGGQPLQPEMCIDEVLPLGELNLELAEELECLAPFGPANPPLTLVCKDLRLKSHSAVGKNGDHLQLILEDAAGATRRAIWWQGAGNPLPQGRFDLACTLRASDYRGQRDIQVEWVDWRAVEAGVVEISAPQKRETVDYRDEPDGVTLLRCLAGQGNILVWHEGGAAEVAGSHRLDLRPAGELAIWTAPPGNEELQAALERVAPQRIYLFGRDPGLDSLDAFLRRLAGLAKFCIRTQAGRTSCTQLGAAMAHRPRTVRAGLTWLAARGWVRISEEPGEGIQLFEGTGVEDATGLRAAEAQLRALLAETAAYRAYFRQAPVDGLV